MGMMKFLGFSFIATILLLGIISCGVPSPVTPEVVTVEPVTGSTITSTDAIIVTFSTSMVPGALTLTGDMVGQNEVVSPPGMRSASNIPKRSRAAAASGTASSHFSKDPGP